MKPSEPSKKDLAVEIAFFEGLRQRMPRDAEVLKHLGDDYTKDGRLEEGLKVDLELSQILPEDASVHYNLACSFSLLGRLKEAGHALVRAVQLGYREWEWLKTDPDLENFRKSPEYAPLADLIKIHSAEKAKP